MVSESQSGVNNAGRTNRGCWLWTAIFVGLPLLLLVLGISLLIGRDRSAQNEVSSRLAERVAEGLPVDNASLEAYHQRLTSDQDASAWMAVLEEVTSDPFNKSSKGVPIFDPQIESGVPSSPQAWEHERATRDFLQRWNSLHNRIERLSLRQLEDDAKPVRFPIVYESIDTLLPYTQNSRAAARLLQLRGQVAVFDRDSASVRRSIEALQGCSNALSGEPILVSQLVSLAIDGMAIELLRTALEEDVLEEGDLELLLPRVLARTGVSPAWRSAIHGEIAMMMPIFRDPSQVTSGGAAPNVPARSRDSLYYLEHMEGILEVPVEDMAEFLRGLDAQEAELEELFAGNLITKFDSILTGMLAPAVGPAGKAFVRDAVQNRMAAICIGLRLFEKREGKMPRSLAELTSVGLKPSDLTAPGQQAFGYQVNASQAQLWGFDVRDQTQVPRELPVIDPAAPYADQQKIWQWRLPLKE